MKYLDDYITKALMKRKKVELYICRDQEGGYGIKIDGKIVFRNLPCEIFEEELDDNQIKILEGVLK